MYGRESIVLQRDVNAVQIPDGTPVTLPKGEMVMLYQSLGGNFTIITESGYMARIDAADADALGKEPTALNNLVMSADPETVEKNVWEVMKTIFDPEIPVNVVDLGLVYDLHVVPVAEGQNDVDIVMTLTAPGCGMGPVLQNDIEEAIKRLPGVRKVAIDLVFDPPWSREMMSDVAKLQLNMM
jgi:probable FeS assembly SUF system protein SufT